MATHDTPVPPIHTPPATGSADPAADGPLDLRDTAADERRRVVLPVALFLATCASTFFAGATDWQPFIFLGSFQQAGEAIARGWPRGLLYMAAVLGILLTHEMGHFLLTLRHRIPASLPYFIPVPFLPFGTMGAVIGMSGTHANRRQMFDVGLAGPLAGLVVAIPVAWIGIQQLQPGLTPPSGFALHPPLAFQLMIHYLHPDHPANMVLYSGTMNPWLMAGWVGMLITGLNMLPISQLDGGHVAHALLGRRAPLLARGLLVGAILFILATERYEWVLMVVLVTLIGTDHPPTADDATPLGWPRRLLGWLALTIPIFCFQPLGISTPR
jgi:membrane-associated protease RseP (regulator of RpoE activity)